jgi:hypothetical protein
MRNHSSVDVEILWSFFVLFAAIFSFGVVLALIISSAFTDQDPFPHCNYAVNYEEHWKSKYDPDDWKSILAAIERDRARFNRSRNYRGPFSVGF